MLTWPHPQTAWRHDLAAVEAVFEQIAAAISRYESVLVVCPTTDHARQVQRRLEKTNAVSAQLRFAIAASNDSWTRDHGPLSVIDDQGSARILNFRFNAWGGKFPFELDDQINDRLHEQATFSGAGFESLPLVLEGGAIDTDGRGRLLATRHSVVTKSRNPGMTQPDIEAILARTLGIRRFFWLRHGSVSGDDTDGHIDTLVRFSDPNTLLYTTAEPDDPDYPGLKAMRKELERLRTATGRPFRLIPLPPAGQPRDEQGRRLPATYVNFLITNGAVLVPTYAHINDELALQIVQQAFPGRDVIAIDCRPIIRQNGSLHCLTMQLPADVNLHSTPI